MSKIAKIILKAGVVCFALTISTVALFLPYEARKKYIYALVRFKNTVNVLL